MNFLQLGVRCRGTALDGTLHVAWIHASKLLWHLNVLRLQKISIYLTHVFWCAIVYSIRARLLALITT